MLNPWAKQSLNSCGDQNQSWNHQKFEDTLKGMYMGVLNKVPNWQRFLRKRIGLVSNLAFADKICYIWKSFLYIIMYHGEELFSYSIGIKIRLQMQFHNRKKRRENLTRRIRLHHRESNQGLLIREANGFDSNQQHVRYDQYL